MGRIAFRAAAAALGLGLPAAGLAQESSETESAIPAPSLAPSLAGPLKASGDPLHVDAGPFGTLYITGAVTGLGLVQNHALPGDDHTRVDLSNGQVIAQTTEGPVQFYIQAGGYSLPSLGTPHFRAKDIVRDTFGLLPVAYVKIAPTSNFSILAGKLPTLQGGENTFTFQNFNIERGLLWNQTNAVNRGVQANYAHGALSVSLALNDGYYSKHFNWLSGTIGYAVSPKDSVTFGAAANVGRTTKSSLATPLVLNNGQLYFVSWTHNDGPWTIQSYAQVGHVQKDNTLGIAHGASTYGAAVLGKYSFTPEFSLAARTEYIKSTGSPTNGAPSLIYGPGSGAWSLTVTPTWQKGIFFVRGEASYVRAHDVVPGFGLGHDLDGRSQARALIETGILF